MKFHEIFQTEIDAIMERRRAIARREESQPVVITLEDEIPAADNADPIRRPTPASKVVGLALSGGGIRSSAFCLGVLQALDYRKLIDRIDYLSTVSGGGYTGTSLSVAMSVSNGDFPFTSELRNGEKPGVQHIRDHSNYLFPQGLLNLFGNVVVYLRGLAANVLLILPWLLLAAAFTIHSNPDVDSLSKPEIAGYGVHLPIPVSPFGLTSNLAALFVLTLAIWALWRSTPTGRNSSDIGGAARFFGAFLVAVLVLAFIELQPWVIAVMFKIDTLGGLGVALANNSGWLKAVAGFLASFATVIGFLGRFLADILRRSEEKPGVGAFMTRIAIRFAMYLAGAAIPILLWVVYLYLSFWGIKENAHHTPARFADFISAVPFAGGSVAAVYFIIAVLFLALGWYLSPNSNSLHRLYRDRLSKAFLFDPNLRQIGGLLSGMSKTGDRTNPRTDLKPLDKLKLSDINTTLAPYHLINAALNIEASKYANRRGRNADFFIFSPQFVGSVATGYVETTKAQDAAPDLTAGTAMAVSGAAASSNMGSATIKPLTPTLAILNVRLGYWLTNPRQVAGKLTKSVILKLFDKLYFLKELFGLLSEDSETIYLTDGGHIENLGIYELLRRRCKLIIAVDAEADPDLNFGSLVNLERYARIDYGLRIDLPWAAIRDATSHASSEIAKTGGMPPAAAPHGPHCALGIIYYPRKTPHESEEDSTGVLLYIKSSLTGDENDYIVDYKRRNPSFPHETTADQFFTEEQFEVYRALGFHAVNSAFKGADRVAMIDPTANAPAKNVLAVWQGAGTTLPLEKRLRDILRL